MTNQWCISSTIFVNFAAKFDAQVHKEILNDSWRLDSDLKKNHKRIQKSGTNAKLTIRSRAPSSEKELIMESKMSELL